MMKTVYAVMAYRYGGSDNTFPIGVFSSEEAARKAAREHKNYRGGKYDHRIFDYTIDQWDDNPGHMGTLGPCIEDGY